MTPCATDLEENDPSTLHRDGVKMEIDLWLEEPQEPAFQLLAAHAGRMGIERSAHDCMVFICDPPC